MDLKTLNKEKTTMSDNLQETPEERKQRIDKLEAKIAVHPQKDYIDAVPKRYRYQYLRAIEGECGKTEAIKMMCMACVFYQKKEVEECQSFSCPLHKFRPWKS